MKENTNAARNEGFKNSFFIIKSNLILRTVIILSIILIILMFFLYRPYSWPLGYEAEGSLLSIMMLSGISFLLWKQKGKYIDRLQQKNVTIGLVFGLLWIIELSVNYVFHPELQLRNNIDNIIFSIIAVLIFINSIMDAYQTDAFFDGLKAGFWSGISSGAVACIAALAITVFGMKFILLDPIRQAEWVAVHETSGSPAMDVYFAYRTFATAIMHLFILGAMMGMILGLFGGLAGKILIIIRKLNTKKRPF
jgi:hypothetical protein